MCNFGTHSNHHYLPKWALSGKLAWQRETFMFKRPIVYQWRFVDSSVVDCQRVSDPQRGPETVDVTRVIIQLGIYKQKHDGGKNLTCVSPKWFPASEIDDTMQG